MGTSKSYQPPTTPQWSKLKGDVTRAARNGSVPYPIANDVLRNFIHTTSGGGGETFGGKGSMTRGNQAAQQAGRRLASFSHAVSTVGFREALRDLGLGEYIGKPVGELALVLVDKLCDDGSTLDEVDARNAISDLIAEMLDGSDSSDEVENILEEKLQDEAIGSLLFSFFGHYLYHQFCRQFYERLIARRGEARTTSFFKSIREFIFSKLENITFGRNLAAINWSGKEGESIVEEVHEQTLSVFGD